jgi:hypothetical protein
MGLIAIAVCSVANVLVAWLLWQSIKEFRSRRPPRPPKPRPPYGMDHYVPPDDTRDYHTRILPIVILVPMCVVMPMPQNYQPQELPMWARPSIETTYRQIEAQ